MKRLVAVMLAAVSLLYTQPAAADSAPPILYSRADVTIKRASVVKAEAMPWQSPEEIQPLPDIVLDTEIRSAETLLKQTGWYNLSSPSNHQAIMLLFGSPETAMIPPSSHYAPLDVMMVDKEGVIREIAPSLMLSELTEPITSKEPVLAILFLRGGAHQALSIAPGDSVFYPVFKKPPAVLSVPPKN